MKKYSVPAAQKIDYNLKSESADFVLQESMTVVVLTWTGLAEAKVSSFQNVMASEMSLKNFLATLDQLILVKPNNIKPQVRVFCSSRLKAEVQDKILSKQTRSLKYIETGEGPFEIRVFADGFEKVQFHQEKPRMQNSKVKVLVVDDSKTMRDLLSKIIQSDPQLDCVGTAELPSQVDSLIERLKPDVITLDINMPEMDGVTLLSKILPKYGIPTLMISAVSLEEGHQVLNALRIGAVDYIQKPNLKDIPIVAPMIIEKIKMASKIKVQKVAVSLSRPTLKKSQAKDIEIRLDRVIAIGASTGGTEAIREVLERLPEKIPPIVITQHIPPVFSKAFASRLNDLLPYEVLEAKDGDELKPGRILIAPGGMQMKVSAIGSSGKLVVSVVDEPPVNRHKPSVDVLFDSVAKLLGKKSVGVILTGMGADGAEGLLNMKKAGALTVAQSEKDCVVFGMPREAIERGAATEISHLFDVASTVIKFLNPNTNQEKKSA